MSRSSSESSIRPRSTLILAGIVALIPLLCSSVIEWLKYQAVLPQHGFLVGFFPIAHLIFGICFTWLVQQHQVVPLGKSEIARFIIVCTLSPSAKYLGMLSGMMLGRAAGLFWITLPVGQIAMALLILFAAIRFLRLPLSKSATVRVAAFVTVMAVVSSLAPFLSSIVTAKHNNIGNAWGDVINSLWFFPFTLVLAYELASAEPGTAYAPIRNAARESQSSLGLRRRGFPWITILVAIAPATLLYTFAIFSAISSYDGYCYGFTDGKWQCSLLGRISGDLAMGTLFMGIPCFFWAGMVLMFVRLRR